MEMQQPLQRVNANGVHGTNTTNKIPPLFRTLVNWIQFTLPYTFRNIKMWVKYTGTVARLFEAEMDP